MVGTDGYGGFNACDTCHRAHFLELPIFLFHNGDKVLVR